MTTTHLPAGAETGPAWEIAHLFPCQGSWSVDDYFELTERTNMLVEFTDGHIEVLEMPTKSHQSILWYLLQAIHDFVSARGLGETSFAPLKVRVSETAYREPDVIFMLAENAARAGEEYWDGADLVMEVVSKDEKSQERDFVTKREDYAAAGVLEYWIVDPQTQRIKVLQLSGKEYVVHCDSGRDEQATSALLDGFSIDVSSVFDAASLRK
jgi:Uma2 family endonuclease